MFVFSKIRHNNKDTPESLLRREEKKNKTHQKAGVSGRQFSKFILRIPDDWKKKPKSKHLHGAEGSWSPHAAWSWDWFSVEELFFFPWASVISSAFWKQIPKRCLFTPWIQLEEDVHHFCKQVKHKVMLFCMQVRMLQAESLHWYQRTMWGVHLPILHPKGGFSALSTWRENIIMYIKTSKAVKP